jgi:hypothetical protein
LSHFVAHIAHITLLILQVDCGFSTLPLSKSLKFLALEGSIPSTYCAPSRMELMVLWWLVDWKVIVITWKVM